MIDTQPPTNTLCKAHSGFVSDIDHLTKENESQWKEINVIKETTRKILTRLTYAAISFALMALALLANLIIE